ATTPDAAVEFSYKKNSIATNEHHYSLVIKITNLGRQLINHFQLQFTFPQFGNVRHIIHKREHIDYWDESRNKCVIRYRSNKVLYPTEEIDVGREMAIQYKVDGHIYAQIDDDGGPMIDWTLHADNMTPKTGSIPFQALQCF